MRMKNGKSGVEGFKGEKIINSSKDWGNESLGTHKHM